MLTLISYVEMMTKFGHLVPVFKQGHLDMNAQKETSEKKNAKRI